MSLIDGMRPGSFRPVQQPAPQPKPNVTPAPTPTGTSGQSSFTPAAPKKYAPIAPPDPMDHETPSYVRMGMTDGNQVVDALNSGGPDAATAKLKQLIAQDAALKNPDHAAYVTSLVGATAGDLAQSLDNDPANAPANFQKYLSAIPPDQTEARSNFVLTSLKAAQTPAAQQAIISGSASVVAQQATSPQSLSDFLGIAPPSAQSGLAALAAPTVAQQVQGMASKNPTGAAQLLDQYVQAAPDAASRKAILDASAPAISQIMSSVDQNVQANRGMIPQDDAGVDSVVQSLGDAAQLAGPDGTRSIADAMAKSVNGNQFVDTGDFSNLWRRGFTFAAQKDPAGVVPLEGALQSSLSAAGKSGAANDISSLVQQSAKTYLNQAKGAYDDAKSKVDQDNQDLSTELSRIGPGLTDAQKQAYISQFHKDHAQDYANQATQAQNLASALNATGPSLLNTNDPDTARAAMDAASELAQIPQGAEGAKDFVNLVESNPNSPLHNQLRLALGGQDDQVKAKCEDILKTAIPNLYAQDVANADGNPDEATAKLKEQLETLENAKDLGDDLNQISQGVTALANHDFNALKELGDGPLGNAFKGAGVILGIAKGVAGGQDPTSFLQNLAATGSEGCELIATATKSLTDTLPGVAAAGELAGKLAPGLNLLSNALSTSQDFQTVMHGGNAGDVVQLIGDSVSTFGSVLDVTGVGAVVGVPLQVVGSLTSLIGGAISNDIHVDHWNGEEKSVLGQIGMGQYANGLTSADPESLRNTAEQLQLWPGAVDQLTNSHPELFNMGPGYTQGFIDAAKACGIQPSDVQGFADALSKDGNYVNELFAQYQNKGTGGAAYDGQLRAWVQGHPDAAAFVQQHSQAFSPSSQQAQRADRDYEMQSDPMGLGNLLKSNSDPAYQAEIIDRLRKDNRLNWFVQQLGSSLAYNGWPQAGAQAIRAAQQQGILSSADAQMYLNQIGQ